METIKNYLENMFSHLPNTPEVQKAKYELYQSLEILTSSPTHSVSRAS